MVLTFKSHNFELCGFRQVSVALYWIIKTSTLGGQGSSNSNRWQGTELPDEKTATSKTPWQVV